MLQMWWLKDATEAPFNKPPPLSLTPLPLPLALPPPLVTRSDGGTFVLRAA